MRSPAGLAQAVAVRTGYARITAIRAAASDLAVAVEENRLLDVALAERVTYLERVVGEFAHKRSTAVQPDAERS